MGTTNHHDERDDPEGWMTYRRKVVDTLDQLCGRLDKMEAEIIALKIKQAVFSSFWGIGGTIVTHFLLKLIEKP